MEAPTTLDLVNSSASQPRHKPPSPLMYLAGQWVDSTSRITVTNPYNNKTIGTVPCANAEHIKLALQLAREYARSPLTEHARADLLDAWAFEIRNNIEALADLLCRENGKVISQARAEILRAAETIDCYSTAARNINADALTILQSVSAGTYNKSDINSEGFITATLYKPLGVITAYTPFNFPANTLVHKVAAAIASGNSIIVKPSEKTPLVALELARLFSNVNEVPNGIVSILTGHHQDFTELFLTNDQVDFFSMTGNSVVGRKLYRQFCDAQTFKRSHFELGGNAAQVVLADFDIKTAADMLSAAVFDHNGSRCTTPRKLLLPEGEYTKKFCQFVLANIDQWTTGNPLDESVRLGALIDESAAKAVESRVHEAVKAGATLLSGGKRDGAVMQATVLSGVTSDMRIFKEENFGPVMCLMNYKSIDDAIAIANLGSFGLQPAVMTHDMKKGWEVASKIRGGCLNIGSTTTSHRSDTVPFGGIGSSGIGKEGSLAGVRELCHEIPYKFYVDSSVI